MVKMLMKSLLSKLLNTPIVIEEGTSGIWKYRKWSNGTAECWGIQTIHPKFSGAYGAVYLNAAGTISFTFPAGLFTEAPVVSSLVDLKGGVGGTSMQNLSAAGYALYIYNFTQYDASSRDVLLAQYAIGKWK